MGQPSLNASFNEKYDTFNLELLYIAIDASITGVVITDNRLPDNPIIYCNPGFEKNTGFSKDEIIGKNCRFLQGPETDSSTVRIIKTKLRKGEDVVIDIINYKKDGTPFHNELHISPIFNSEKKITHFIGIQHDVTLKKSKLELGKLRNEESIIDDDLDETNVFKVFLNNLRRLLPKI